MSKWVPKPGSLVSEDNRPRPLTESEIESIIDQFPDVTPVNVELNNLLRGQFQQWVAKELQTIACCPSEVIRLGQQINNRYEFAKVDPGTPVGPASAEGMGASNTQNALSSFKEAGKSKNIGSVSGALKDILYVLQKYFRSFIYFKRDEPYPRNPTYREALSIGLNLVELTIGNIVEDVEVSDRSSLYIDDEWWYESFITLFPQRDGSKRVIPKDRMLLRLYLRKTLMYEHRISIYDVVRIMESELPKSGVICVASPQSIGIIDVYPSEGYRAVVKEMKGVPESIAEDYFFTGEVIPLLDKISIKGIPGIKKVVPTAVPIWSSTQKEVRLTLTALNSAIRHLPEEEDKDDILLKLGVEYLMLFEAEIPPEAKFHRSFVVHQDLRQMKINSITYDDINHLLDIMQIERHLTNESAGYIIITLPEDSKVEQPNGKIEYLLPGKYIVNAIAKEEEERKRVSEEQSVLLNNPFYEEPIGSRKRASEFHYLQTEDDGRYHLAELWSLDYVDPEMTITNNFEEIRDLLGIEALRQYYTKELLDALRAGSGDLPPSLHLLVIDTICHLGRANGIAFWGSSRLPKGFVSRSTEERVVHVMKHQAIGGGEERAEATSVAISTGQLSTLGTGSVTLVMKAEEQKRLLSQITNIKEAGLTLDPVLVKEYLSRSRRDALEGEVAIDEETIIKNTMEIGETIPGRGLETEEKKEDEKADISKIHSAANFPIMSITSDPYLEGETAKKRGPSIGDSIARQESSRQSLAKAGLSPEEIAVRFVPPSYREFRVYMKQEQAREATIYDYDKWIRERFFDLQTVETALATAQVPSRGQYERLALSRDETPSDEGYREWLRELNYDYVSIAQALGEEIPLPPPEPEEPTVINMDKEMKIGLIKSAIKPEPAVAPELLTTLSEIRMSVPSLPGIAPTTVAPLRNVHNVSKVGGVMITKAEADNLRPLSGGALPSWIESLLAPVQPLKVVNPLPTIKLPTGIQLPDYRSLLASRSTASIIQGTPQMSDLTLFRQILTRR